MTQQVQQRNAQMVDLLRPDFQHRKEPNFAWRAACSMYLALPGLRGFWPMSSVGYTVANRGVDESGQGNHLTDNNTVEFGYDSLVPYCHFTLANNEYLSRADGGAANWADILGTETYIEAAYRGMTIGGWFYFDTIPAATVMLMAKLAGGQQSYRLRKDVAHTMTFSIRSGGAWVNIVSTSVVAAGQWYYIVGRFVPGASVDLFINEVQFQTVTAAAVGTDSNAIFTIGARGNPDQYFDGRASMCFLCAAQLSNAIILSSFDQTKAMYGVS